MKGLWLEAGQLKYRDDLPVPQPADDECLVRVEKAGICSTDIAMLNGLYPFSGILGHEFACIVEDGPEGLVGRRIVSEINVACGNCDWCRRGLGKHCPDRSVIGIIDRDGAFAEIIRVPKENIHRVPANVNADQAVFVEPLAAALDTLEKIDLAPEHKVLVVGAGKLGQLVARVFQSRGCDLRAVARSPAKIERLRVSGIAVIRSQDVPRAHFDIAVECTGNQEGLEIALMSVRAQGIIALRSTYPGTTRIDTTDIVVEEKKIIGTRCGPSPGYTVRRKTRPFTVDRRRLSAGGGRRGDKNEPPPGNPKSSPGHERIVLTAAERRPSPATRQNSLGQLDAAT